MKPSPHPPAMTTSCCPVVELRRYALHPGAREPLVALFDREFVETQEAVGITVVAQFRDLDDPDAFVWLRGFPDMDARAYALAGFYDGPVWAAHRDAANATMIDSDNVRLLRPAWPGADLAFDVAPRPAREATALPPGIVVATVCSLRAPAAMGFVDTFRGAILPALAAAGASLLAALETEPAPNTFPRLPVREGEHGFVWFDAFVDEAAHNRHLSTLAASAAWRGEARPALDRHLIAPEEQWRLAPTARSRPLRPASEPER